MKSNEIKKNKAVLRDEQRQDDLKDRRQEQALPDNDSDDVYRDANTLSGPEGPAPMLMLNTVSPGNNQHSKLVAPTKESINQDSRNQDCRQGTPTTEPQ